MGQRKKCDVESNLIGVKLMSSVSSAPMTEDITCGVHLPTHLHLSRTWSVTSPEDRWITSLSGGTETTSRDLDRVFFLDTPLGSLPVLCQHPPPQLTVGSSGEKHPTPSRDTRPETGVTVVRPDNGPLPRPEPTSSTVTTLGC